MVIKILWRRFETILLAFSVEGLPAFQEKRSFEALLIPSGKKARDYVCIYLCKFWFSNLAGYQIDARTGHCYKFHKHADIWERAHKICQAEGGYLAVINSNAEAKVLSDLFIRSQTPKYTPYFNTVAIGFREWGQENSWWTIHGKINVGV